MTANKINEYDAEWYNSPEHEELLERVVDAYNEASLDRIECACKIAMHSPSVIEKEYWIQYIMDICLYEQND